MHANAGRYEEVGEGLICPACKTRYDAGSECPECQVHLVGESFADTTPTKVRQPETMRHVFTAGIVLTLGALFVVMMIVALNYQP